MVVMSGGMVWKAVGLTATTVVAEPEMSVAHETRPSEIAMAIDAWTVAFIFVERGLFIASQQ
jgi:hypothetical protein